MENLRKMSVRLYMMLIALTATITFTACEETMDTVTPEFPQLQEKTVSVGDVFEITFNANLDWKLESDAAWCKFVNGEFKETTAQGKAGEQTLKVEISDESWNYTTDDVAQISLQLGDSNEVIYKMTRARKIFTDMVVSDAEGNVYNAENPIVIKGGTPSNPAFVEITVSSDFQVGVLVDELPDWILLEAGEGNGVYSLAFNEASENENIKYPVSADKGYSIPFAVDYNGEIIPADVPVVYEGMDAQYAAFSQAYVSMHNVSMDGKTISSVNYGTGETATYEEMLETVVTARNDDYEVVKFVQLGDYMEFAGMDPVFYPSGEYELDDEENLNWVSVNKDADNLSFTFAENTTGEVRSAVAYVLPRALYDEVKDDLLQLVVGDNSAKYNTYMVLNVLQLKDAPAAPSVSFKAYLDWGEGMNDIKLVTGEDVVFSSDPSSNSYVASFSTEYFSLGDIYLEVSEFTSDMTIELSNEAVLEIHESNGKIYVKIKSTISALEKITVKQNGSAIAECQISLY